MANTVLAGDYSGLISFKGDKKGLLITENKFFGAKKTFINKTTVDHYELVMQEGNSSMGSGVARGALAQHSLAELAPSLELTPPKRTAITLSRSSSKTGLRLCVLLTPTTTKPLSASCTEVQMEKLAPTRSGLFICPFRPASPRLGTARCPCPCYTARTASGLRRGCRLRPTQTSWRYPL